MKSQIIKKAGRIFKHLRKNDGMTLIEIMIVVAIIGILSAIVGPALFNNIKKADVTSAKNQIKNFETALEMFNLENKSYPTTDEGLKALVEGGYIKKIPQDPWKHDYVYRSPGEEGREYEIISLGEDGKDGGEGFAADIKSWE